MKVSDEFTVPLCRLHHREVHRAQDERTWWNDLNIQPLDIALKLWHQSHEKSGEGNLGDGKVASDRETTTPDGYITAIGSAQ